MRVLEPQSAFEALLVGMRRLPIEMNTRQAAFHRLQNWPLNVMHSILPTELFDVPNATDFLDLVVRFLNRLPNNQNSFVTLFDMFEEDQLVMTLYLIPDLCFPFVSMVVTKICELARNLNRENPAENSRLQNIRDRYPKMILQLLQNTVLVMDPQSPQLQHIQNTVDSASLLLRQTNEMLDSILSINPLNSPTRQTLDENCDLSELFSLTVRTLFCSSCRIIFG